MDFSRTIAFALALAVFGGLGTLGVLAHGDVTPLPVDTAGLEPLGEEWREVNPYRGNEAALKVGTSAFNQGGSFWVFKVPQKKASN